MKENRYRITGCYKYRITGCYKYRITGCYNHVNNPQEILAEFFLLEAEKQVPLRFDRDTKDIIDSNPESEGGCISRLL